MKAFLGDEYETYLASYSLPKYQGFRVNTLKTSMEKWETINPFKNIKTVPWCDKGYYYEDERPAKHPYYYAGLFYIQEPSAMSPGAYIPIEEGDKVLDLCAAPGGKSTQVAAKLGQSGVLVSNDISVSRAKALHKNIDNFGARNVIVTSESPERLASKCQGYFDKILIDAPCSGEGMFRKDEGAIKSWETHGIDYCVALQREILESAAKMLKVGGMILYSTCTFSPEENEGMMDEFMKKYPEFKVVPLEGIGGITEGRPEWIGADESLKGALRLWPHRLEGEGHFLCLLQKTGGEEEKCKLHTLKKKIKDFEPLKDFIKENTCLSIDTPVFENNGKFYIVPEGAPDLSGLRIVRSGLLLGELKGKVFKPAHAVVLGYPKEMFKQTIDFKADDQEVIKYLKGETLLVEANKGYYVVCVDGYPLGWAKGQNNTLKNQYPATWRMMG